MCLQGLRGCMQKFAPVLAGAVLAGAAHYGGSARGLREEGIDPRVRLKAIPMAVSRASGPGHQEAVLHLPPYANGWPPECTEDRSNQGTILRRSSLAKPSHWIGGSNRIYDSSMMVWRILPRRPQTGAALLPIGRSCASGAALCLTSLQRPKPDLSFGLAYALIDLVLGLSSTGRKAARICQ